MFYSYKQAADYLDRARNKTAGRPLTTHIRVHDHPDGILIAYKVMQICFIRPDDTVEFVASERFVADYGFSLVRQIPLVLPLTMARKSRGVYEIWSSGDKWEYFEGIKFKFSTVPVHMVCLNPRLPLAERVNVNKRLAWRRALRAFKRQVALRAKLGVIDVLIANIGTSKSRPPKDALSLLYNAIRTGEVTTEFLGDMIQHARYHAYWMATPGGAQVAAYIGDLCTGTYSVELRKKFSVFDGE
jgi:hypothetical protein